jgi:hypothetical protein
MFGSGIGARFTYEGMSSFREIVIQDGTVKAESYGDEEIVGLRSGYRSGIA